jgi:hypothetical protein
MFPNIFGNTWGRKLMFRPHFPSSGSNMCDVCTAQGGVEHATNGFDI